MSLVAYSDGYAMLPAALPSLGVVRSQRLGAGRCFVRIERVINHLYYYYMERTARAQRRLILGVGDGSRLPSQTCREELGARRCNKRRRCTKLCSFHTT